MLIVPSASSFATAPNVPFRKGCDAGILASIHDPAVNVAVWTRRWSEALGVESTAWAAREHQHEIEAVVDAKNPFSEPFLSELSADGALLADIKLLLELFIGLSDASRVHLFFGTVRDDQCRKFHQDYIRLRLIHTYFGPGTEWAPEAAVRREALDQAHESVVEANRRIVPDASLVQHAQPGEVLVLKGTRYPGNRHGAIHRSPSIAHLGLTRVVLVLTTYDK